MTPNNFFTTNPLLAAFHLFIWLLWRPSTWQTQVVEILAPRLNGDFAWMNLSASQWRQPTTWRLLRIVHLVSPFCVGTIVGLVLILINQDWVLALRGIIYVVTLSLVGGLVSGLLVSVGFSFVATTIESLLVGLLFYFEQDPWYDEFAIGAGLLALRIAGQVLWNLIPQTPLRPMEMLLNSILATGALAVSAIIVTVISYLLAFFICPSLCPESRPENTLMIGLLLGILVLLGIATQRWFISGLVAFGFVTVSMLSFVYTPSEEETKTLTITLLKPLIGGVQNGMQLSLLFALPYLLLARFLMKPAAILAGLLSSGGIYVGIFSWWLSQTERGMSFWFLPFTTLVIVSWLFPWKRWIAMFWRFLKPPQIHSASIPNPYITGVPLLKRNQELFVGRRDIVTRIDQILRTQPGPPILLYGQRRLGKSSLLNALSYLLSKEYLPLLIDLQGVTYVANHSDFFYQFSRAMINSARLQNITLSSLPREAWRDSPEEVFEEWLDCLEVTHPDRLFLLTIDEYEELEELFNKGHLDRRRMLSFFRHLIQHRPRFRILFAGVCQLQEFPDWTSYLINAEAIHLSYLQPPEVCQLIQNSVAGWLDYTPAALDLVLALTRGQPALVQMLGKEIVVLKNSLVAREGERNVFNLFYRYRVTKTDVEEVVPQVLKTWKTYFYDVIWRSRSLLEQSVLQWLANQGEGAIIGEEQLGKQFGQEYVKGILPRLIQAELIEWTSQGYRFQVELMRRWLTQESKVQLCL